MIATLIGFIAIVGFILIIKIVQTAKKIELEEATLLVIFCAFLSPALWLVCRLVGLGILKIFN